MGVVRKTHKETRVVSTLGALSRALAGAALVASCLASPSPSLPASSGAPASALPPSTASPNVTPSGGPTPVPGAQDIGAQWERVPTDMDWRLADIARGPEGWVVAGSMR